MICNTGPLPLYTGVATEQLQIRREANMRVLGMMHDLIKKLKRPVQIEDGESGRRTREDSEHNVIRDAEWLPKNLSRLVCHFSGDSHIVSLRFNYFFVA